MGQASREIAQQLHRAAVRPVQVFQHDEQPGWAAPRDLRERRADRGETARLLVAVAVAFAACLALEIRDGAE